MRIQSILFISLFSLFILNSCSRSGGESNKLSTETSPYLLQHASNPVNWYPWGDEAFEKAVEDDKLMIISIGYSACHWCHVMERESFEDSIVANVMNENFVSVKIDREERPDLDMFYVEAANLMTGRAGWPLNIIALSDGSPIYAGTYYPKDSWIALLNEISDFYSREPDRLKKQGASFIENFKIISSEVQLKEELLIGEELLNELLGLWTQKMDRNRGGLIGSPKFPLPASMEVFMKYGFLSGDTTITTIIETTLDEMIKGGIYDHLGGGFARYSTDSEWRIPHFEKMLYDNAQLISLYSKAYKLFKNPEYKRVVYETIGFMDRELSLADIQIYYSSLDADSEEEEGTFYVWQYREIEDALEEEEFTKAVNHYNLKEEGNWEDLKNILYLNEINNSEELEQIREKLFLKREKRERPSLDDKKLLSWNSLAVSGLVEAYKAFSDIELKRKAIDAITYLTENYYDQQSDLYYHLDNSEIVAFLDDLAFYSRALIDIYEITYDEEYLNKSLKVTNHILENYSSDSSSLLHFNHKDHVAVSVNMSPVNDGVEPSSNGIIAQNLFVLGNYFYDEEVDFISRSKEMSMSVSKQLQRYPMYYYTWFDLNASALFPEYEIAVVGDEYSSISEELFQNYIPNALFLGGKSDQGLALLENKKVDGETYIYVCEQKRCKLPVKTVKEAMDLINQI